MTLPRLQHRHDGVGGCAFVGFVDGDDAPSLSEWTGGVSAGTVAKADVVEVGAKMGAHGGWRGIIPRLRLRDQMPTLAEFQSRDIAGSLTPR